MKIFKKSYSIIGRIETSRKQFEILNGAQRSLSRVSRLQTSRNTQNVAKDN
jgi:hypothetical protein